MAAGSDGEHCGGEAVSALPEAIAFAALAIGAAWLEVAGKDAGVLWVIVWVWALLSDWGQKK